jgi:hypothetical protein
VIRFLAGAIAGAFSAAYLIGWWLSATPESRDAVAPFQPTSTTTGPTYWHGAT